jgi:outer membrane protein
MRTALALTRSITWAAVAALCAGAPPVQAFEFNTFDPWQVTPSDLVRVLPGSSALRSDQTPASCDETLPVPTGALDLQQAISLALCHSPQTRLAWASVLSQAAQLGQSKAAYLPTLNITVSRSVDNTLTQTSGDFSTSNNTHVLASGRVAAMNWLLWDLGGRAANVRQAQQSLNAALASQDAAVQSLFGNTAQAYYDTWAAQAAFDSARLAEAGARDTLAAATARVRLGAAPAPEALQARAALAQATLVRARAEGTARLAAGALAGTLGLDARTPLTLVPDPALSMDGSPGAAPASEQALNQHLQDIDTLMNQALLEHPSVRAAQAQLAAAQAKADATVAEGLPSLSASVGRYINGRPNTPLSTSNTHETISSIQLNIPLFDGFSRNYRIRDARAQVAAKQADLAAAKAQASLDVWRNFQTLQAEATAVAASADLLRGASAVADAAKARLRAGAADLLETINADRDLANARQERIRALAAWRTARLKLLASLGRVGFWALGSNATAP